MALDLCQNFVSAQYLENESIKFHKILYMHWYWQDLGLDCYLSFLAHFYQSYDPWFTPNFCFHSISWEPVDSFTKLYICIYIDKIYVEIATFHILLICNRVMALDWCQNFVSSQYLWDLTFLQHEKHCSGAIIRFSDNSSSHWLSRIISLLSILAKCTRNCKLLRRIHARVSNRFQHLGFSIQNAADNATHRCTLIAFGHISPIIKRLVPWLGQINGRRSPTECHLLITFANSLDPDQAWQNVRFDLDPICLTLRIQSVWHSVGIPDSDGIPERILRKNWFRKKSADNEKAWKISQEAKGLANGVDWNR